MERRYVQILECEQKENERFGVVNIKPVKKGKLTLSSRSGVDYSHNTKQLPTN
jgi:hypothetical protein